MKKLKEYGKVIFWIVLMLFVMGLVGMGAWYFFVDTMRAIVH